MLLPFSLALIVMILSVWQEILLEPSKEKYQRAVRAWESTCSSVPMLPTVSTPKPSKKYRIKYSSPTINRIPRFPR